jgi:single-stranded DNA-binding protein
MVDGEKTNNRVDGLVVTVTKLSELKTTGTGKLMFKASALNETDEGEKNWVNIIGFGLMARNLSTKLKKGARCRVYGNLKTKEYQKSDGTVGVDNTIFLSKVQVAGDDKLETIDEFSGAPAPF